MDGRATDHETSALPSGCSSIYGNRLQKPHFHIAYLPERTWLDFFTEVAIIDEKGSAVPNKVRCDELYKRFCHWFISRNKDIGPPSKKVFGSGLKKIGFIRKQSGPSWYWIGLKLRRED